MLDRVLTPPSERVYAVMRVILGPLFAFHGTQKVFGFLAEQQATVMSQLWKGRLKFLLPPEPEGVRHADPRRRFVRYRDAHRLRPCVRPIYCGASSPSISQLAGAPVPTPAN